MKTSKARPGLDARGRSLPSPGVRLGADFLARVVALCARRRRSRAGSEGAGRQWATGGGFEFVGYRPYRAGEDVRAIDWTVFAREDRPFVRATRRELASRLTVLVDTSASMGLGVPGKLERAAQVALAACALALESGAEVTVATSSAPTAALRLRRPRDLAALVRAAERWRAGGTHGLRDALAGEWPGRWLLTGDLVDLAPHELARASGRHPLDVVQVLAPHELDPPEADAVAWEDPESGERRTLRVDRGAREAWARHLDDERCAWRRLCRARRGAFAGGPTTWPFERWIEELERWTSG